MKVNERVLGSAEWRSVQQNNKVEQRYNICKDNRKQHKGEILLNYINIYYIKIFICILTSILWPVMILPVSKICFLVPSLSSSSDFFISPKQAVKNHVFKLLIHSNRHFIYTDWFRIETQSNSFRFLSCTVVGFRFSTMIFFHFLCLNQTNFLWDIWMIFWVLYLKHESWSD